MTNAQPIMLNLDMGQDEASLILTQMIR
jgi:hypothetical protein